jgi:hypothetical protein
MRKRNMAIRQSRQAIGMAVATLFDDGREAAKRSDTFIQMTGTALRPSS